MRLIDLLRRADVDHLKRALDRMDGQHGDRHHDPHFREINSVSPLPAFAEGITLGDAIQRLKTAPLRAHLGDTGDAKYVVTFRTMEEVIGAEKPLSSITRAECAVVQELFPGLPANASKLRAYKDCKTTVIPERKMSSSRRKRATAKSRQPALVTLLSPGRICA